MKKDVLIQNIIIGILLVIGLMVFNKTGFHLVNIINSLFIFGMIYILIGLFRFTRKLHLYDIVIYSTKKFAEVLKTKDYVKGNSKLGDYHDYVKNTVYDKNFKELLFVGFLFVLLSFVLLFL